MYILIWFDERKGHFRQSPIIFGVPLSSDVSESYTPADRTYEPLVTKYKVLSCDCISL